MIKKLWHWFNCKIGNHELYSYGEDCNFDFYHLNLNTMDNDELMDSFIEQTTLRCRHCEYTYSGRLKYWSSNER